MSVILLRSFRPEFPTEKVVSVSKRSFQMEPLKTSSTQDPCGTIVRELDALEVRLQHLKAELGRLLDPEEASFARRHPA
jgi:hypothetical protein